MAASKVASGCDGGSNRGHFNLSSSSTLSLLFVASRAVLWKEETPDHGPWKTKALVKEVEHPERATSRAKQRDRRDDMVSCSIVGPRACL